MAEYAGYVAPQTVDYGAISSGLLSSKLSAEQLRQSQELAKAKLAQQQLEKQQKLEQAQDKQFREDLKGLNTPEQGPDKTMNQLFADGLFSIKDKNAEMYNKMKRGEITNKDYILYNSNATSQFNQLVNSTKQFNKNFQELTTSVAKGEQSKIGAFLIGKLGNAGQAGNKKLGPSSDDSGRLELYTIDKDGNKIKEDTLTNIELIGNKSIWSDPTVDYDKIFKGSTEAIGKYKIENNLITIESQQQNPKFKKLVEDQINGVIASDLDKTRVLVELKGYYPYSTEEDKQLAFKEGATEDKLIKFEINSKGAYSPVLDETLRQEAYDITRDSIVGRMDYSKTLDEPRVPRSSTTKKTQTEIKRSATYKKANDAYKSIKDLGDKSPYKARIEKIYRGFYPDYGATSRILYFDPKTKKNIAGLAIYALGEDGRPEREVDRLMTAEDYFGVYTPRDKKGEEDVEFMTAEEEEGDFNDL
jgi:hypothetical protein